MLRPPHMGQDLPVTHGVNRIERACPDPVRIKHITSSSEETLYEFKMIIELAFGNTKQQNLKDLSKAYILGPGRVKTGNYVQVSNLEARQDTHAVHSNCQQRRGGD